MKLGLIAAKLGSKAGCWKPKTVSYYYRNDAVARILAKHARSGPFHDLFTIVLKERICVAAVNPREQGPKINHGDQASSHPRSLLSPAILCLLPPGY